MSYPVTYVGLSNLVRASAILTKSDLRSLFSSAKITAPAPTFSGMAWADGTFKQISLSDYAGKYVALVFYPKDFTFVCPSELIALDHKVAELEHRNCVVLGVSMDDAETHAKWRQTAIDDGGIGAAVRRSGGFAFSAAGSPAARHS